MTDKTPHTDDDPLDPYAKRADGGFRQPKPLDQQWPTWILLSGVLILLAKLPASEWFLVPKLTMVAAGLAGLWGLYLVLQPEGGR